MIISKPVCSLPLFLLPAVANASNNQKVVLWSTPESDVLSSLVGVPLASHDDAAAPHGLRKDQRQLQFYSNCGADEIGIWHETIGAHVMFVGNDPSNFLLSDRFAEKVPAIKGRFRSLLQKNWLDHQGR